MPEAKPLTLDTAHFVEGQILGGKYRVERVLGRGGMGVVVAARHLQLGERVALKLMREDTTRDREAVKRFLREARAAARLQSTHVARVSDVGLLEDERPYMVMEYLDGVNLRELLLRQGPLSVQDTVDYVLQAAEAIAEAHSLGIVHRDLKPANLFLTTRRDRTPHIKVLDFGISKVTSGVQSTDQGVTTTNALLGSPLYMSPEQMMATRDVDARADIWALGVIAYELLVGAPPFVADTLPQICVLVMQGDYEPLASRRPDVPFDLDRIIARCLAKAPSARYGSVAELALELQAFAGPHGGAALDRILQLGAPDAARLSGKRRKRRSRLSVGWLIGAIPLLGFMAAALWRNTAPAPQTASSNLAAQQASLPNLAASGIKLPVVAANVRAEGSAAPAASNSSRAVVRAAQPAARAATPAATTGVPPLPPTPAHPSPAPAPTRAFDSKKSQDFGGRL